MLGFEQWQQEGWVLKALLLDLDLLRVLLVLACLHVQVDSFLLLHLLHPFLLGFQSSNTRLLDQD
jgi:hypothetical protein